MTHTVTQHSGLSRRDRRSGARPYLPSPRNNGEPSGSLNTSSPHNELSDPALAYGARASYSSHRLTDRNPRCSGLLSVDEQSGPRIDHQDRFHRRAWSCRTRDGSVHRRQRSMIAGTVVHAHSTEAAMSVR